MTPIAPEVDRIVGVLGARLDSRPLIIMLDVDGTLAPIAPKPSQARVPDGTRAVIERLRDAPDVHVALVSGRGASDALSLVGVSGLWALGNHGIELVAPDGSSDADPAVREFAAAMADAARALGPLAAQVAGAILEDKRWTLSLHYRLADPTVVPALLERARAVAESMGLRVTDGKMVMEVRPPVALDKGTAAVKLAERLGGFAPGAASFFAGDDRTDEDAFRALRARASSAITVRVGGAGDTAAELSVGSTDAFRDLLVAIAARRARDRR